MLPDGAPSVYASGECEIDLVRRELRLRGSPVPLGGRAFEMIEVLARSAGELVTKDELMDRVWPGAVVLDNTLHVHLTAVRKALGLHRHLLKTETGRGYRLLGDWTVRRHDATGPPAGLRTVRVADEAPAGNLPASVTRLVGRAAGVARLRDLLSAYRVVTLTGAGGIGKTSLALEVARRGAGEFADGAWLVELASLSNPAPVASTVAGVLGLGFGATDIVPESLARAIGQKRLLLVLDNCEHVIAAVATLAETLLARCPRVTILATSREILRIEGEQIYRVPPLTVPVAEHIGAARILEHSAPELFFARATELGADFSSDSLYPSMIAEICRRLDGIPLAIEFAAARAATLGVRQVAAGLHDQFAMLTSGRRTALQRHQTLRATLDWSFQLLTETERELLHRLAIFAGPFSLDAACAVAGADMTEAHVTGGIADLIGKSLVTRSADAAAEFRLFDTTRVYALDRPKGSGALADIARRHAGYFLRLLAEERRADAEDDRRSVLRRRADEVHVALDWAFSAAGDVGIALALTLAAAPVWFELCQMMVARARLEQALRHPVPDANQEMRLRVAMGHALWYTNTRHDDIEPTFSRALDIAERIGAPAVRAQTLWGLWAARRARGDFRGALEMARRLADAGRSADGPGASHLADRILGLTHHYLGELQVAREFTERALRQPHHLDASLGLGYQVETPVAMATQLARILWLQGFPDQATVMAARAVDGARSSGHSIAIDFAAGMAGVPVPLWTGALDEARHRVELLVTHSVGNQRIEQWVPHLAGLIRLREGGAAERLIASYAEPRVDVISAVPLAHLTARTDAAVPVPGEDGPGEDGPGEDGPGEDGPGEDGPGEDGPGEEPAQVLWNTPELLRVDAELLLWHGGPGAVPAAEAKLLRSLEIARAQGALSWELRTAMSLARVWHRGPRAAEAHGLLAATYGKFTEGFATSDLVHARRMMAEFGAAP